MIIRDWLIGINAPRLFSVLYGVTLNVGRVMSPTLALLVQREADIGRVTDSGKVTDHHAIIPTAEIARTDLSGLSSGERDVLTLIVTRFLSATAQVHRFEAVATVLDCRGHSFTVIGFSPLLFSAFQRNAQSSPQVMISYTILRKIALLANLQ